MGNREWWWRQWRQRRQLRWQWQWQRQQLYLFDGPFEPGRTYEHG